MTNHVVAGTGPRALERADSATRSRAVAAVRAAVGALLDTHGERLVIMSGMARGFDHLLARTALDFDTRLWCAIPTRSYGGYYWGRNSLTGTDRLDEFTRILNQAWRTTYVMEDIHHTSGLYLNGLHANYIRNQFMVDAAAEFLTWNPRPGSGTDHCVKAARRAELPVNILSEQPTLPLETP